MSSNLSLSSLAVGVGVGVGALGLSNSFGITTNVLGSVLGMRDTDPRGLETILNEHGTESDAIFSEEIAMMEFHIRSMQKKIEELSTKTDTQREIAALKENLQTCYDGLYAELRESLARNVLDTQHFLDSHRDVLAEFHHETFETRRIVDDLAGRQNVLEVRQDAFESKVNLGTVAQGKRMEEIEEELLRQQTRMQEIAQRSSAGHREITVSECIQGEKLRNRRAANLKDLITSLASMEKGVAETREKLDLQERELAKAVNEKKDMENHHRLENKAYAELLRHAPQSVRSQFRSRRDGEESKGQSKDDEDD